MSESKLHSNRVSDQRALQHSVSRFELFVSGLFFVLLLLVALNIYQNYGVHTDEYHNQYFGDKWIIYIKQSFIAGYPLELDFSNSHKNGEERHFRLINDSEPKTIGICEHDLSHGPIFEMLLAAAKFKGLFGTTKREVLFGRHLISFLFFFVSVFFFYLLVRYMFGNWLMAWAGCLMLVLHPRIFSHAFYNTVDVAFMASYLIATYTLVKYLDEKNYPWALAHAVACAIMVDIRVAGCLLVLCTFIFAGLELIRAKDRRIFLWSVLLHFSALSVLVVLFWPMLWSNPIFLFIKAATFTAFHAVFQVPAWSFNFKWIFATTPPAYIGLFALGFIFMVKGLALSPWHYDSQKRNMLIMLYLIATPIILPILLETNLYNGWRHHYFVYPIFVLISLTGLQWISDLGAKLGSQTQRRVFQFSLIGFTCLIFALPAWSIYKHHPHEHSYYSSLAPSDIHDAKGGHDYWGVSTRYLFEYILRNDPSESVTVYTSGRFPRHGRDILPPEMNRRLHLRKFKDKGLNQIPKYVAVNYRSTKKPIEENLNILLDRGYQEVYSVWVSGRRISSVFKLTAS